MGLAACLFHWSPDAFAASTPHEFWAALEAHQWINRPREGG